GEGVVESMFEKGRDQLLIAIELSPVRLAQIRIELDAAAIARIERACRRKKLISRYAAIALILSKQCPRGAVVLPGDGWRGVVTTVVGRVYLGFTVAGQADEAVGEGIVDGTGDIAGELILPAVEIRVARRLRHQLGARREARAL